MNADSFDMYFGKALFMISNHINKRRYITVYDVECILIHVGELIRYMIE